MSIQWARQAADGDLAPFCLPSARPQNATPPIRSSLRGMLVLLPLLGLLLAFASPIHEAHAAACSQQHIVLSGETLSSIATQYGANWTTLAAANGLADPNRLVVGQTLCIPAAETGSSGESALPLTEVSTTAAAGQANVFAFPECTWWANERYHELHGVYVPWTTNADAWQWPARAIDFGWHISSIPHVGDMISVSPDQQGAAALGHVGIVEQLLPNGHVITSNTNWGPDPMAVTTVEFVPGPGVRFISR
jgi:N-acetylmuramoyl-L-alanine amidase